MEKWKCQTEKQNNEYSRTFHECHKRPLRHSICFSTVGRGLTRLNWNNPHTSPGAVVRWSLASRIFFLKLDSVDFPFQLADHSQFHDRIRNPLGVTKRAAPMATASVPSLHTIQLAGNLRDTGEGTDFIFFTARGPAHANRSDNFVACFDRHSTSS